MTRKAIVTLAADPYPPFDGSSDYPIDVRIAPPVEQGRLGVFFRGLLAIPAPRVDQHVEAARE